jgi:WD40 repeat protein
MYTGEMIVQFTGINHYHHRYKYIGNNILVTGGVDYTIRVWDLANKRSISCFNTIKPENEGYRNSLSCMGIQYLGGTTVMYENSIGTQEIFDIYKGHLRNINITCFRDALCVIDERRIAGGLLNDVTIVDFHKGTIIAQMKGHERHISGIAYVGKQVLVSASRDATVRVWDLSTHTCLRTIGKVYLSDINYSGHDLSVVRHIYGDYVAVGSGYMGENNIKIWNIANGDLIKVFPVKSHVEYMEVFVAMQQPEWLQLLLTKNFSDVIVLCPEK